MISYVFQRDGSNWVIVHYESGYERRFEVDGMYYPTYHFPKTVEKFMENADYVHVQGDFFPGYSEWTKKADKAA